MNGGPRREGRPHAIPPAPGPRPQFEVLHEIQERLVALALWEGLKDVVLWAASQPITRSVLFHTPTEFRGYAAEALSGEPELIRAWNLLTSLVRQPASVNGGVLAECCRSVYGWAEERGLLQTAAHFAEAAALLRPDVPELANLAARTCRRAALPTRAGPWYQRGRALAIRNGNFAEKFSASVGYGWLMYSLGRYDRASRPMQRAARQALNKGHTRMAGEAEHNLLAICSEQRLLTLGETYARRALGHYPIHHPMLPFLVHDVAYLYVACALYHPVVPVVLDCIKTMPRAQDPVLAWSTAARAAAGSGRMDVYRQSRDTALALVRHFPEHAPATFRNLAYAAQLAEEWEAAEDAARRALELAAARRMADVESTSRELLNNVLARQPGAGEVKPPANSRVEEVVRLCHIRLRQWMGPKRGRPPGTTPPA